LFLVQLLYVVIKTPRLPPPPLSGVDFRREGIVVRWDDDGDEEGGQEEDVNPRCNCDEGVEKQHPKEFRLVLVGDSPVEGIGNTRHKDALGGQTARAFAKAVYRQSYGYDCVRYWSFGKSGLTAKGIEEEMVPLVHRTADDLHNLTHDNASQSEPMVHAIVLLCGVNDVLDPRSTTTTLHNDVHSLIRSIRTHSALECTPLIVLGLPDFAKLPFLPFWPLGWALGWRGRRMQCELERAIAEVQLKEKQESSKVKTTMVRIPEVTEVLDSIGYCRHDSSMENVYSGGNDNAQSTSLQMRLVHPLLKHLGHNIDQDTLASLEMDDFLSDDGFHPGRYGTVYIGSLVTEAYTKLTMS
jgi:lysophospholipase L1-like esterase